MAYGSGYADSQALKDKCNDNGERRACVKGPVVSTSRANFKIALTPKRRADLPDNDILKLDFSISQIVNLLNNGERPEPIFWFLVRIYVKDSYV